MSPSVPTVPLNDKRAIPTIAFGTGSALRGKNATAFVVQALDGGFNHIDTAQAYRNEESVGEALRQAFGKLPRPHGGEKLDLEGQTLGKVGREDIWVTTKYGGDGNAEEALDLSLKKLGLPSVDLYLIHNPRVAPDILKTWSELESARAHGKAKSIGVSNFSVDQLELIVKNGKTIPSVNQIQFHPYNYHENVALLNYAKEHGIVIESYGGLTPITRLPGGKLDTVLTKIAARLGPKVTPGQVILSWIHAKGVVIVTTTSRKERIQEYLTIFDLPALTEDEIATIDEAGKHAPAGSVASCRYTTLRHQARRFAIWIIMFCIIAMAYRSVRSCS
ncbi:hypothetical protein FRC08_006693 [Ceratobasidium sp. 394]|nr:hypothetical protein FRC08_006693 [Ceratobasidium sp. 394]